MVVSARLLLALALLALLLMLAASTAARGALDRGAGAPAPAPTARAAPAAVMTAADLGRAPRLTRLRAPRERLALARVRPGHTVAVRQRPNGRVRGRIGSRTPFGSAQVLGVAAVRGRWLGVATTARPDGRLGWIRRDSVALRVAATRIEIRIDLSARRLDLRRGGRVVRRAAVAVGRPGSPTPRGRFSVTDKLDGRRFSPYYGCCILALSGEQPNPPPGWTGGNRLAIHGTNAPAGVGRATSAGCLRAGDRPLRALMRAVPLGTPVRVVA